MVRSCMNFGLGISRLWIICVGLYGFSGKVHGAEQGKSLQFNRDVRPILSDHCYACHGPDAHSRKAKLRLDKRESALGTNREGAAIVPGKPDLSEMVFRIHNKDPDEVMPPPELNKPLSPAEKKILARWIGEGAKYEKQILMTSKDTHFMKIAQQIGFPLLDVTLYRIFPHIEI